MWYVVHEVRVGGLVDPDRNMADGDECFDDNVETGGDVG